jgi:glycerophosphoryl diester phosphodiesterase
VAPRIWGHRGAPESFTENTREADVAAIREGADGLSIDARAPRDGLVLVHDATLERLTGRPTRIADKTVAQLRAETFQDGTHIAEVAPIVDEFRARDLDIEIKSRVLGPDATADRLASVLEPRVAGLSKLYVSSFDARALRRFARRAPDAPLALLLPPTRVISSIAEFGGRLFLRGKRLEAIHPHHSTVTPDRVARWHRQGLKVHAYTVDQPEDVLRVAAAGVDSIITNRPAATREVLRRAGYEFER